MAVHGLDYGYIIRIEIDLIEFYYHIIFEDLMSSDLRSKLLNISKVKRGYSRYVLDKGLTDSSFSNAGMRSAYIFLNIPCFSSCIASHFLNFLYANLKLLRTMIYNNSLTICCLGGGPGGEMMTIVKSVELMLEMFCYTTEPLFVNATIVDVDFGWANVSRKVTQNWWKCIDSSLVFLNLSFKQADLTQPLSKDLQELLKNSDVVTMIKLVSAVHGTKSRDKIPEMLQDVVRHMKKNGVLFYLNCSRFSRIQDLNDVIAKSTKMVTVYGPLYRDPHQISGPSRHVCYKLYSPFYGDIAHPTYNCRNHIIAWRKFET